MFEAPGVGNEWCFWKVVDRGGRGTPTEDLECWLLPTGPKISAFWLEVDAERFDRSGAKLKAPGLYTDEPRVWSATPGGERS